MNSYLFYDLETSGLNKAFDQILQFAAIRTDMQLNEIERHNFLVKINPDIIPSPYALITHRISINESMRGIGEYEAACKIHRLINAPGTISIGYNSLGFDDEFLRFTFHRNLLPPYTHQYSNGCRRMDLYPIAVMYHLYKHDIIAWPVRNGKCSLKLEDINQANALASGNAHDAMVDVEATLALARRLVRETDMWNYLSGSFVKKIDQNRTGQLPVSFQNRQFDHTCGIMVNGEFGSDLTFQAPVLFLGQSRPYPNQSLWLRMDLPELRQTAPETIAEIPWVIRKRYGEPGILLPPLERYLERMESARIDEWQRNTQWLQSNPDTLDGIIAHYQNFRYPDIPDLDPEAALYQMGFPDPATQSLCRRFHRSAPADRAALIERFSSREIQALAIRLMARNFPDELSGRWMPHYRDYRRKIHPEKETDAILDYKGTPRTTPVKALAEIDEIKRSEKVDDARLGLLEELADYLKRTFPARTS